MARRRMNFKSKGAYQRWLAYDHIHNPEAGAHPVDVDIAGKHHQVMHARRSTRSYVYYTAHRHKRGHHGGPCDGACRRGIRPHKHRSGSSRRG